MSLITLVIADDHAMFRQGLRSLIATASDFEIVAECGNGTEAIRLIRQHSPMVAIMDISMPEMDGITATSALRREGLNTPVVILTTHDDPLMLERATVAGAQGYVNKEFAFEELLDTIRLVAQGRSALVEMPVMGIRLEGQPLTDRELEVMQLVVSGKSNRLIAEELGISIKTVDNHRTRLMAKLQLHTTADLVRYAIKTGMV